MIGLRRWACVVVALVAAQRPHPAAADLVAPSTPPAVSLELERVEVDGELAGPGAATPLSLDEVRADVRAAWVERYRSAPPAPALAMLVAHVAHETGRGAAMRSYNYGWLGCANGWRSPTIEYVQGRRVRAVARWCAYRDRRAGARAFVAVVSDLPSVLRAAQAGDPTWYAQALSRAHYYTAPPAAYAASLGGLYREQLGAVRREGRP